MSDPTGPEYDPDDALAGLEDEEQRLERTRVDYSGIDPHSEFQPVDEVELAEEGMLLDDPERLDDEDDEGDEGDEGDSDDEGPAASLDPDDVGWDLDEQERSSDDEDKDS